ncbi:TlpA family protein disulfide reductase [Wenzhouxiangella sediminis]|uniref:TlpA family protein disulfide reductase n=1 Tax=Wenzhouxiangella sediminis TaxID=1792836 RepID=A0A3E1K8W5_9GAMM|nr:TlpA disulfide reductase family protein [Wenzhouxiangella sediminis]RFF30523.1 TlpA family protein disulfide reductase [Wenzhouxiangella sediminis]
MKGWRLWVSVVVLGFAVGTALAWLTNSAKDGGDAPESGLAVGESHPGFALPALDGGRVDAAQFAGRAMLVNFWATWCAPCRREMPVLQAASERHGDALAVVGVALDDPEPVADFVEELGIAYTILVGQDEVLDVQSAWGNEVGAMPYTVLVDGEGIVRWLHYGEVTSSELDEALGDVL